MSVLTFLWAGQQKVGPDWWPRVFRYLALGKNGVAFGL